MTINKSIGELTTLDGSLDKTLKASEQLKDLPQILQKYMLLGNYQIGNAKKFDSHSIFNDIGSIDGFIAQFVNLDEAQQKAFLSLSSFDEGLEDYIENTKNAVQIGEKFNSQLFEQIASQKDGITTGVLNEFMKAGGLKDAKGVLALPNTQDAIALMEDYANHCSDASKTQQLFNAGILEQENGVYKLSQAFLKEISVKQASTVATVALTAAQKAWNVVAQYGKQLLLSLGVAAVAFIATKIVDYLMNLKTHSEELVATMNDSHDAAEQATKDVEEIQSKIDELNKSLKDAGVKKIEDIVDPAERERLQAVNDMLQAQLELKKQLEKDANDKANADTSAVVNDKTEDSIVKSRTVNVSYAEGGANAGTHQVAEKVSKTESLHEYAAALEDTTQKRRDLQVELDQIEASSGKDSEEYANKKKELDALNETFESQKTKVEELSTAVSEQMGNYKTDADSFAQYKDEYVAGTNAMTAATKALANAQDNTGIDTTNLDIFSEKIKQIKNDIDNGDSQQSDWKTFNGLDAFSGMSGEAIINIDKDSSHQTETETAALEKLHKTADENKISFESLIGVFESFGLVQISNSAAADDYADKLEKTMGVIDNIQSAYKACSSAVEEYNQYGYMSVDSLQALLQMDDQYLNTLELVNGKLQVNQSAYADLLATQYAEAQMEAISQAISELNAIAKGDAAEKAETFTEATEDEKNKLTALCPALKDATVGTGELAAALAAAQGAANGEDADAVQAKIDGVMNALNTRLTLIGNNMSAAMNGAAGLRNQLDGFSNSSKKAADSSNKAADSSNTLLDAWSTLTSAMEEYNKWGSISLNTMKSLMGLDSKYTSCLKKQGNELVVDATACRDLIQAELKHAAATNDGTGKIGQYNQVLEYLDTHAKNGTISLNQLKDAIEGVNTALDEATGKTDEFQSGMEILHDLSKIDNANGEQIADYDTLKKVTTVFSNQTVTATYTESVRKYTVRYMNRGAVLKETVAPYGSMVLYDGDTPTYTSEETAFKYYLFSGWDKGGYVTGDKDINAVYDSCEYSSTYFDGKEIGQLRPVEIYAMNKVGVEQNVATPKDEVSIKLGNDFSYEDITEKVLISKPQVFDGKNYIDTDLKLFEEDRDFVLAVDYKMDVTNANNTVLMQCFEQNGMNGIRLWNSTGVKMTWGIDSANGVAAGSRDMTVIRHIKGDNGLYVYSSNIYGSALSYTKITRTRSTKTNATLVFGCAKADDGAYERHAKGTVYWAKLWYADLGDAACRELAAWTHDNLIVEVASFKNYYLSDNSNKRCSMTFLQKDTLGQDMMLSSAANNAGGWGSTSLREYLDSRLVDALPIGWKQLIKKVKVPSSAGNKSKEIVTSDCYFFIPSAIEVSSSMIDEPYVYEGQTISYMTGNDSRVKHNAEGKATKYWLRSPFATYDGYFYAIEETGELYGFHYPSEQLGVTVMFSI